MKTITAKRLELAEACAEQVSLFRDEWKDKRVPLTRKNWDRAGELGLDRPWMECFLKGEAKRVYVAVRNEAGRVYAAAEAAVRNETGRVYAAAEAAAWRVYEATRDEALFKALTAGVPE